MQAEHGQIVELLCVFDKIVDSVCHSVEDLLRILEKKLGEEFTCEEIIHCLRHMDMRKVGNSGYIPAYTRTELTDKLHEYAGFRTDYEITPPKSMAGIIRRTKGL